VRLLRRLQGEDRLATPDEQQILARWSGWGAVPKVFDESDVQFAAARAALAELLSEQEWRAAARTTLNAHYTDAAYAQAMWDLVTAGGLPSGARVLEPGCGAGTFLGLAPDDLELSLLGVELDPTTAAIARYLYPDADVRAESFADTRLPNASIDLVIGNVPFGKLALHDKTHNPSRHSTGSVGLFEVHECCGFDGHRNLAHGRGEDQWQRELSAWPRGPRPG
jgi:SAM-dependent methyltransferase